MKALLLVLLCLVATALCQDYTINIPDDGTNQSPTCGQAYVSLTRAFTICFERTATVTGSIAQSSTLTFSLHDGASNDDVIANGAWSMSWQTFTAGQATTCNNAPNSGGNTSPDTVALAANAVVFRGTFTPSYPLVEDYVNSLSLTWEDNRALGGGCGGTGTKLVTLTPFFIVPKNVGRSATTPPTICSPTGDSCTVWNTLTATDPVAPSRLTFWTTGYIPATGGEYTPDSCSSTSCVGNGYIVQPADGTRTFTVVSVASNGLAYPEQRIAFSPSSVSYSSTNSGTDDVSFSAGSLATAHETDWDWNWGWQDSQRPILASLGTFPYVFADDASFHPVLALTTPRLSFESVSPNAAGSFDSTTQTWGTNIDDLDEVLYTFNANEGALGISRNMRTNEPAQSLSCSVTVGPSGAVSGLSGGQIPQGGGGDLLNNVAISQPGVYEITCSANAQYLPARLVAYVQPRVLAPPANDLTNTLIPDQKSFHVGFLANSGRGGITGNGITGATSNFWGPTGTSVTYTWHVATISGPDANGLRLTTNNCPTGCSDATYTSSDTSPVLTQSTANPRWSTDFQDYTCAPAACALLPTPAAAARLGFFAVTPGLYQLSYTTGQTGGGMVNQPEFAQITVDKLSYTWGCPNLDVSDTTSTDCSVNVIGFGGSGAPCSVSFQLSPVDPAYNNLENIGTINFPQGDNTANIFTVRAARSYPNAVQWQLVPTSLGAGCVGTVDDWFDTENPVVHPIDTLNEIALSAGTNQVFDYRTGDVSFQLNVTVTRTPDRGSFTVLVASADAVPRFVSSPAGVTILNDFYETVTITPSPWFWSATGSLGVSLLPSSNVETFSSSVANVGVDISDNAISFITDQPPTNQNGVWYSGQSYGLTVHPVFSPFFDQLIGIDTLTASLDRRRRTVDVHLGTHSMHRRQCTPSVDQATLIAPLPSILAYAADDASLDVEIPMLLQAAVSGCPGSNAFADFVPSRSSGSWYAESQWTAGIQVEPRAFTLAPSFQSLSGGSFALLPGFGQLFTVTRAADSALDGYTMRVAASSFPPDLLQVPSSVFFVEDSLQTSFTIKVTEAKNVPHNGVAQFCLAPIMESSSVTIDFDFSAFCSPLFRIGEFLSTTSLYRSVGDPTGNFVLGSVGLINEIGKLHAELTPPQGVKGKTTVIVGSEIDAAGFTGQDKLVQPVFVNNAGEAKLTKNLQTVDFEYSVGAPVLSSNVLVRTNFDPHNPVDLSPVAQIEVYPKVCQFSGGSSKQTEEFITVQFDRCDVPSTVADTVTFWITPIYGTSIVAQKNNVTLSSRSQVANINSLELQFTVVEQGSSDPTVFLLHTHSSEYGYYATLTLTPLMPNSLLPRGITNDGVYTAGERVFTVIPVETEPEYWGPTVSFDLVLQSGSDGNFNFTLSQDNSRPLTDSNPPLVFDSIAFQDGIAVYEMRGTPAVFVPYDFTLTVQDMLTPPSYSDYVTADSALSLAIFANDQSNLIAPSTGMVAGQQYYLRVMLSTEPTSSVTLTLGESSADAPVLSLSGTFPVQRGQQLVWIPVVPSTATTDLQVLVTAPSFTDGLLSTHVSVSSAIAVALLSPTPDNWPEVLSVGDSMQFDVVLTFLTTEPGTLYFNPEQLDSHNLAPFRFSPSSLDFAAGELSHTVTLTVTGDYTTSMQFSIRGTGSLSSVSATYNGPQLLRRQFRVDSQNYEMQQAFPTAPVSTLIATDASLGGLYNLRPLNWLKVTLVDQLDQSDVSAQFIAFQHGTQVLSFDGAQHPVMPGHYRYEFTTSDVYSYSTVGFADLYRSVIVTPDEADTDCLFSEWFYYDCVQTWRVNYPLVFQDITMYYTLNKNLWNGNMQFSTTDNSVIIPAGQWTSSVQLGVESEPGTLRAYYDAGINNTLMYTFNNPSGQPLHGIDTACMRRAIGHSVDDDVPNPIDVQPDGGRGLVDYTWNVHTSAVNEWPGTTRYQVRQAGDAVRVHRDDRPYLQDDTFEIGGVRMLAKHWGLTGIITMPKNKPSHSLPKRQRVPSGGVTLLQSWRIGFDLQAEWWSFTQSSVWNGLGDTSINTWMPGEERLLIVRRSSHLQSPAEFRFDFVQGYGSSRVAIGNGEAEYWMESYQSAVPIWVRATTAGSPALLLLRPLAPPKDRANTRSTAVDEKMRDYLEGVAMPLTVGYQVNFYNVRTDLDTTTHYYPVTIVNSGPAVTVAISASSFTESLISLSADSSYTTYMLGDTGFSASQVTVLIESEFAYYANTSVGVYAAPPAVTFVGANGGSDASASAGTHSAAAALVAAFSTLLLMALSVLLSL